MRFHWQNLNEGRNGKKRCGFVNGRCWLYWGKTTLRCEWVFRAENSAALEVDLGTGEADLVGLYVGFFLFKIFLTLENFKLHNRIEHVIKRGDQKYGSGRVIGVKWHDEFVWIDLWNDPMESRTKDPWWWHMTLNPADFIFGRAKYESQTLKTERVVVPMPEGPYPATVNVNEDTWKRPRWFRVLRVVRCEVRPDTPIPFPGKGENSWDCGEDATHSMYCNAETPLEAAGKMMMSVMDSRIRHGSGWNWRPAIKVKA